MRNIKDYFKLVGADESNAYFLMRFRGINIYESIKTKDVASAFKQIEGTSFGNHFFNNAKCSALAVIKQLKFDAESKYDNWDESYLVKARLSHHFNGVNFASILKGSEIIRALKSENIGNINMSVPELLNMI